MRYVIVAMVQHLLDGILYPVSPVGDQCECSAWL